ncbi:P-loop containing nucleoside triphosphate hydrolase protein [Hypoxylon sp. FL1150]|nr:P-loop containing nucleoside triphosphate hydrolase protein [Hypoxylon sp. FL1150]
MLPIISIIGVIASGKRTLGRKLAKEFGFYHLSVGDFFRSMSEIPLPIAVQERIDEKYQGGELIALDDLKKLCDHMPSSVYMPAYIRQFRDLRNTIPSDIAIPLLEQKIEEVNNQFKYKCKGILIDGFPRKLGHFMGASMIRDCTRLVICIECHPENARARFARRLGSSHDISVYEERLCSFQQNLPDLVKEFEARRLLLISPNESDMNINQAYQALVNRLSSNEHWKAIVGPTYFPLF